MLAAALGPILGPSQKLRVAHALLRLSDSAAADTAHHQLMPEFVLVGQLVGFPMPFTSPSTCSSAMVRVPSSGPRSGSASPVWSSGVNTGFPSASQMLAAMRPAIASPLPPMASRSDLADRYDSGRTWSVAVSSWSPCFHVTSFSMGAPVKAPISFRLSMLSCMIGPYVALRIQALPPDLWMVASVVTTLLAAKSNGKSDT